MTQEEWGPWIEHDGKGCPVPFGTQVWAQLFDPWSNEIDEVVFVAGQPFHTGIIFGTGGDEDWTHGEDFNETDHDIHLIRYRIRKPRGMKVLEELLQNLPEDVDA